MKNLTLILLVNLLFFSCKKTETPVKPLTANEKAITASVWEIKYFKLTNFKTPLSSTGNIEYTKGQTGALAEGFSKARVSFKKDYTLSAIGATGSSSYSGTWSFLNNETKINIQGTNLPGVDGDADIVQLNANTMILKGDRTATVNETGKSELFLELIPVL
ncbi:MAG: hypothetical protein KA313_09505 [Pseudarcicella sp.]|nr:hypothetical protein [Pseudarcicella sp.]MBP6411323.1 hypothetical protein [Pseudarcicella sp.]